MWTPRSDTPIHQPCRPFHTLESRSNRAQRYCRSERWHALGKTPHNRHHTALQGKKCTVLASPRRISPHDDDNPPDHPDNLDELRHWDKAGMLDKCLHLSLHQSGTLESSGHPRTESRCSNQRANRVQHRTAHPKHPTRESSRYTGHAWDQWGHKNPATTQHNSLHRCPKAAIPGPGCRRY